MIEHFQHVSALALTNANLRPPDHPVHGGPGWKVFLDKTDQIRRTIRYIGDNPTKMRLARQSHPFAQPYNNWPFHEQAARI